MQNVSHREIITKRGHHQRGCGDGNGRPARDSGAARCFAQTVVVAEQGQHAGDERIRRQGKGQQKCETAYLWHEMSITYTVSGSDRPSVAPSSPTASILLACQGRSANSQVSPKS